MAPLDLFAAERLDSSEGAEKAPEPGADAFEVLFEIGRELQTEVIHPERVLSLIVERAAELLQTDVSWIALFDHDAGRVQIASSWGAREPAFDHMEVALGSGLGGVALRRRRTLIVTDYETYSHETPAFVRDVMLKEGIISVMCAPMLRGEEMVGALYVGNRRKTAFLSSHASLLSTLAAQASVAIHNGLLYRELEERNDLLEQSFAIHRELTSAELREIGLAGIAQTLARLLDRPIVVDQEIVQPLRSSYDRNGDAVAIDTDGAHLELAAIVPIVAVDEELGRIVILGGPLSELQERALEHGATVMALELVKQRAAYEVEWRLQGELLEELMHAPEPLPESLALRAKRLNIDPYVPRQIVAIEGDGPRIDGARLLSAVRKQAGRVLGVRGGPPLAVRRGQRVILSVRDCTGARATNLVEALRTAGAAMGGTLSIGVSRPASSVADAYREAEACLLLAKSRGKRGGVVHAADLGPLRFLLDASNLDQATAMVRERLGPILIQDRSARAPLFETLRVYVATDGHQPTVAARCFIHISTLKYRLRRIQSLVGAPLSDPDLRFELRVAFEVLDLLEAVGLDPLGRQADASTLTTVTPTRLGTTLATAFRRDVPLVEGDEGDPAHSSA